MNSLGRALGEQGHAFCPASGHVASYLALRNNQWDVSNIGIVRFGRAAATVSRIACDYKLATMGMDQDSEEYAKARSEVHQRSAERLLQLCCINGGAFVKVGQHVGALDYLLPVEYVRTLRVLHSKAPASPLQSILQVLREDLGQNPEDVFSSFSEQPIGAASLAQVHRATLRTTGETVAVKVQHPSVLGNSLVDMATMELLVNIVAKIFPEFSLMWLAEETKRNLPLELDFVNEAHNTDRVRRMFSHFPWLEVPKIHWDLTTRRVMTMQFCEGGQVNDKAYMEKNGISAMEVSSRLGQLYSEMIFVQGYVHCDPHPGNLLVRQGSQGPTLVLLDHGLYTELTDQFRLQYAHLWLALIRRDLQSLEYWGNQLGVSGELYKILSCIVSGRSWTSITRGIDRQKHTKAEGSEIKEFASQHFPLISQILGMVPRQMLLIFKTNDLLRGIEASLGTRGAARSFITMSRCCVRAVYEDQLKHCASWWSRMVVVVRACFAQSAITVYQTYLWFRTRPLVGRLLRAGDMA
uniref:ABC1 atypical kinase-like domain-containing protein n=1 Tax=Rhipicephalus pulchellus TaxID=72859 RepID=L7LWN6_RHIPC